MYKLFPFQGNIVYTLYIAPYYLQSEKKIARGEWYLQKFDPQTTIFFILDFFSF